MRSFAWGILAAALLLSACTEPYIPKPRGYFRMDFLEHKYRVFDAPGFPYTFEYPVYSRIVRDTMFFGERPENPFWVNIVFPELGGSIYLSYKQISPAQTLDKLLADAHYMSYFHDKRANSINDTIFATEYNVKGVFFNVGGDAASAYQFFATDSANHCLRGALYFDVRPNADSLEPANQFLKKDMEHLLGTLRWK